MTNGCMAEGPRKVCALWRRHDSLSELELGGDGKGFGCSLAVACDRITNLAQFGLGSVNLTRYGYGFVLTVSTTGLHHS
jgi:hypothetical protein